MPQKRASCSRVTHPCAGRHQELLLTLMLPLDLHVLSLPLAFILSQDQTLHCIMFLYFQFDADTYNPSKELTLLDKLYFSVLASCTVISLFNELLNSSFEARFSNGAAKVRIIFKLPNFFLNYFQIYVFQ